MPHEGDMLTTWRRRWAAYLVSEADIKVLQLLYTLNHLRKAASSIE